MPRSGRNGTRNLIHFGKLPNDERDIDIGRRRSDSLPVPCGVSKPAILPLADPGQSRLRVGAQRELLKAAGTSAGSHGRTAMSIWRNLKRIISHLNGRPYLFGYRREPIAGGNDNRITRMLCASCAHMGDECPSWEKRLKRGI